jgi:16S rRNA (cytosine1402-N4)-methyltransferase
MHLPVLAREVLEILKVDSNDTVVDGTMNGGGHTREFLHALGFGGTFIGIEWDSGILEKTEREIRGEFAGKLPHVCVFAHGNYRNMPQILRNEGITQADAILLDIGFSSEHIDDPQRGFSFRHDGPLDMRYDASGGEPASAYVNSLPAQELADIFFTYGEERRSRQIAKAITEYRKKERITTTGQLKGIVESVLGDRGKIHPATKTFQALRIFVNDELGNLRMFLEELPSMLSPRGKCGIITFHSLEDRMVKQAFKNFKKEGIAEEITKKPVSPSAHELALNPRSRSAKLRAIMKV